MNFRVLAAALAGALSVTWGGAALAQAAAYPNKPIRFIVPYPPGGPTDTVSRLVSQKMAEKFGQQVIVDNKPGASGVIGLDALAKSAPDGYTVGLAINTFAINASIMHKLPYDTAKGFTPVATLASGAFLMSVNPQLPAKDLPGFITLAKAKARSGGLTYGMVGNAGIGRIAGELLATSAGIDFVKVPFKGSAEMLTSLMSGEIDFVMDPANIYLQHIAAGKVRPMAVTGTERLTALRDVPTFAQSGLAQFDIRMWFGVLAPAGVPPAIVQKLSAEYARILALPEVREKLAAQELRPFVSDPAEFATFLKNETERYAKVVKTANIKEE